MNRERGEKLNVNARRNGFKKSLSVTRQTQSGAKKQKAMTVRELKELLEGADDDMLVLLPVDMACFDGYFQCPCVHESGLARLCVDEKTGEEKTDFVLVPCGFFDDEHDERPYLN